MTFLFKANKWNHLTLTKEGAEAIFVQVDVQKEEEIQNLLDVAVKKFGKIDIAFNNAGTDGDFTPFTEQTNENCNNIIETNVKGAFWSMKREIEIFDQSWRGQCGWLFRDDRLCLLSQYIPLSNGLSSEDILSSRQCSE